MGDTRRRYYPGKTSPFFGVDRCAKSGKKEGDEEEVPKVVAPKLGFEPVFCKSQGLVLVNCYVCEYDLGKKLVSWKRRGRG